MIMMMIIKLVAAVLFKAEMNWEINKCHRFFWVTKTITVEFAGDLKQRGFMLVAAVNLG